MAGEVASYRPIDWFDWLPADRYRVGDDGSVWRWYAGGRIRKRASRPPRWRRLRCKMKHDQRYVDLRLGVKCKGFSVSYLVLRAFVGPRPFGCIALHYPDRDRLNDRLANLRWAPRGAQRFDADARHLGSPCLKGSDQPSAKLKEDDIPEIFRLHREGWSNRDISDEYDISKSTVWDIINRRKWRHVVVGPDPNSPVVG